MLYKVTLIIVKMFRLVVTIAAVMLAISALPARMPTLGHLGHMNEEEFEDYLDAWLAIEEQNWVNTSYAVQPRSGNIL